MKTNQMKKQVTQLSRNVALLLCATLFASTTAKADDRGLPGASVTLAPITPSALGLAPVLNMDSQLPLYSSTPIPGAPRDLCGREEATRSPVSCGLRSDDLGIPRAKDRVTKGSSTGRTVLIVSGVVTVILIVGAVVAASTMDFDLPSGLNSDHVRGAGWLLR